MKPFIGRFGLFSSFADDSFFSFAADGDGGGDCDAAFKTAAGVAGVTGAAAEEGRRRGECCKIWRRQSSFQGSFQTYFRF